MGVIGIDPVDLEERENYYLLTGIVVPRPIGWVSTVDATGQRNLAPHSYFNLVSSEPPVVLFSSIGRKDTLRNIEAVGEFVVNVVSHELVEPMNLTSADFPPEEDEFSWAELEAVASTTVAPPRVNLAKVALECQLVEVRRVGNGNVIFGRVVFVHIDESVWRLGRVDPELLQPVGRLGGAAYATVKDVYKISRPSWDRDQKTLRFPPDPESSRPDM